MTISTALTEYTRDNKINITGILITFIMSAVSIYLQYDIEIELDVISNFNSTTTLSEKVEHRLTFINSGNRSIAIESVSVDIKKPNGQIVNSELDIIQPFVLDAKMMKVIDLNHILINKDVSGFHATAISFSVIDATANIHRSSFDLGVLNIGGKYNDGSLRYPSYRFNLIKNTKQLIE
ncbi:hypothetical protein [Agarilytica rhodophyticola]|uniref:hypothetical protein n=1 Tax=Agarilytica rhodophyticola TaxID=1737490 RepID=UPI001319F724|nr:hypothetical protein [Agarilytica rhodophyticola]